MSQNIAIQQGADPLSIRTLTGGCLQVTNALSSPVGRIGRQLGCPTLRYPSGTADFRCAWGIMPASMLPEAKSWAQGVQQTLLHAAPMMMEGVGVHHAQPHPGLPGLRPAGIKHFQTI